MDPIAVRKKAWREHLRAARQARKTTNGATPSNTGESTAVPLVRTLWPRAGEWAAAFESTPTEPATEALLADLAAHGVRVLVPAPGPERQELAWSEIEATTCALPVASPSSTAPHRVNRPSTAGPEALTQCELILVPALAVDRSGTRLGQGGGWYDRTLQHATPGALILGVCFPEELLTAGTLPRETHDQPVHGALTPTGLTLFH